MIMSRISSPSSRSGNYSNAMPDFIEYFEKRGESLKLQEDSIMPYLLMYSRLMLSPELQD